jgi:hypothetical protein
MKIRRAARWNDNECFVAERSRIPEIAWGSIVTPLLAIRVRPAVILYLPGSSRPNYVETETCRAHHSPQMGRVFVRHLRTERRNRCIACSVIALHLLAIVAFAQTSKIDLTGTWVFTVQTSAGGGMPNITLKQEGDKVAGHYSGQLGEADLSGSVNAKDVSFSFLVNVQGTTLKCTYMGSIESSDSLKGTVDISGVGQGTFTAKRQ